MTTAITPHANHNGLDNLASRFVSVTQLPWEKTDFQGITVKTLLIDKKTGLLTALMRMLPGAELPDHEHMLIEQTFVLEGHLVCPERECKEGDFVWRPAGSRHKAWSPEGGLFLAMFQVPISSLSRTHRPTCSLRSGIWLGAKRWVKKPFEVVHRANCISTYKMSVPKPLP